MTESAPVPTALPPWLRALDVALTATVVAPLAASLVAAFAAVRVYRPRRRANRRTPADLGLAAEAIGLAADGGTALDGWFVPRAGARHTVVIGHGMARNKAFTLPYVAALHRAGYHVLTFDLRNHGDSGGDRLPRRMGDRSSGDLARVLAYTRERPETASGAVALLCFSFSTWTALLMASRVRDPRLRAVVCDSGPEIDLTKSYDRLFTVRRGALPLVLRGPILFALARAVFTWCAIWMLAVEDWPPVLESGHPHLLFITGELDPVVPSPEVARLAARWPGAGVWAVPGASHTEAFRVQPEEYERRLCAFLEQAFGHDRAAMQAPGR
jgi:pimeloyl-ACP methyl ester carboxylesterase